MPELSEKYLEVLLKVSGENLDAKKVNPLLVQYDNLLKNLKVEEQRSDGKVFQASIDHISNRKHEIIDENTLICSRQIKFNIYNPYPHSQNNLEHHIYVLLHKKIMELAVKNETPKEKIIVRTLDTSGTGDFKKGRWPMDDADRIFASLI